MNAWSPLPPAGPHGGDGAAIAAALGIGPGDVVDLSQSLNPFAPDPSPVVDRHLDALRRYPDPTRATEALAEVMGVDRERLLLTNGGAEAIALVGAELGRARVDDPDFALYARHLVLDPDGPLVRSNPHNPSGLLAPADQRAAVWDEAFYPLATGSWTRGDPDTLVVGSLTKLLACPGLRLGYVLAPSAADLAPVADRQPGWSVNGLAAAALPELLSTIDLADWSRRIAAARSDLVAVLAEHGLVARPSDAPWVLVDVPAGPDLEGRGGSFRSELARRGVVVRDCSSFGLPDVVRIAVAAPAELGRLARALDQVLPSSARRPEPGPSAESGP
jgi:histidinol-phosphate/aromatic aminotransferase/cobyric acid decarboxylase-like protein